MFRKLCVRNITRGTELGDSVDIADSSAARRTGLLKHSTLEDGEGLWIVPCSAIHTFFMRFAIDTVYINKHCRVLKLVPRLQPGGWSMSLRAYSVLELPAGVIEQSGTQVGDQLELAKSRLAVPEAM